MAKAIFFVLSSLWLASPGAAGDCALGARDLDELRKSPFSERLTGVQTVADLQSLVNSLGAEGEKLCAVRAEANRYIPAADPHDPGKDRTVPLKRLPAGLNPDDPRYRTPDDLYKYLSSGEKFCVKQRRAEQRLEEANGWKRNSGLG